MHLLATVTHQYSLVKLCQLKKPKINALFSPIFEHSRTCGSLSEKKSHNALTFTLNIKISVSVLN